MCVCIYKVRNVSKETYCLACLEHLLSSAANTQNSPNVSVSDFRLAHCRAHTSISNTKTNRMVRINTGKMYLITGYNIIPHSWQQVDLLSQHRIDQRISFPADRSFKIYNGIAVLHCGTVCQYKICTIVGTFSAFT